MNAAWSQFPLRNTDQSAKRMITIVQLRHQHQRGRTDGGRAGRDVQERPVREPRLQPAFVRQRAHADALRLYIPRGSALRRARRARGTHLQALAEADERDGDAHPVQHARHGAHIREPCEDFRGAGRHTHIREQAELGAVSQSGGKGGWTSAQGQRARARPTGCLGGLSGETLGLDGPRGGGERTLVKILGAWPVVARP